MNYPERQNSDGDPVLDSNNTRSIIIFLIIGLVAGWLASWIVGGGGLLTYLVSGVLGAFVGGYLFSALKITLPIRNVWLSQIVTATVGAVIVVIVARLIT